ncbi:MAG: DnaJ domain-containing protein, partial [Deltaproteobacteria bacterium]|nr:DnaJ domain-containing protein [Deltaproteobacteria bacterium]
SLGGLEPLGGSNTLALWRGGEKELLLVEGRNGSLRQTLSGHRFPVRALLPGAEGALLSLDEGNSLLNWNGKAQITGNFFVDQAPKGFQAGALFGVGRGHLLAVGQPGGGLLLSAKDGTLLGRLAEAEPGRTAVSPTGRYLLTGVAGVLRLYGFARAVSPLDYVRYLRALGGDKIAQSYARLLDERNLPPRAKADLLTEANREPAARRLQTALARLALAQEQKDAAEIRQWAKQVLALQPENPTALAALRTAQEEEYQALLTQAREHLKTGQFRQAITLLDNAIPPASPLAAEAAALIREAENQRGVLTALEQARDKMERGDLTAAEAIVKEVLRQNEEHPAALSLADEIHGRAGGSGRDLFAVITGGVLALLGMGWFMRRQKTPRKPLPSGVRPELKPGSDRLGATAAASRRMAPEGNGSPQRPAPGSLGAARPRPAADASRQTRRKVATELAAKTEEMIRLARQADTRRQYTSLLMELEAELSSLHRRLHDPATDPGPLHIRLKEMVAHLRTLDFREPERADSAPVKEEPSYYEVLQVEPQAGADQIKTAYHRLLKQYHPDLHNQSTFTWVKEEAERMSRRLSEAYEVLINADKRRKYDQELKKRQGGTT